MTTPGTPVSGPGKFSQRTDKQPIAQLNNANYGEQKAYKQLQQDAPMAASPDVPGGKPDLSQMFQGASANVTPIGADSSQPNTPVTDGANAGPGQGQAAVTPPTSQASKVLASYLPALEFMANQPGTSDAARNLVRQIKYTT